VVNEALPRATEASAVALRWASRALVATVWISAMLFGLYILAFYAGAATDDAMQRWNTALPRLYEPTTRAANAGIGLHFAAGGVILILGSIQLVAGIRDRAPVVHRWLGRVYVTASIAAGVGGLAFIAAKGTIGGPVMSVGFAIYGALMVIAAVQTIRHARAARLDDHRAWALRLYALAIGSWLYRMDYGFWHLLAGGAGHTHEFRGPFDAVMAFWFYIPNLVIAEAVIRARRTSAPAWLRGGATAALVVAVGFLLLGTYFFTKMYWGPAIVHRVLG
jgi:uncharacterized membrane protein